MLLYLMLNYYYYPEYEYENVKLYQTDDCCTVWPIWLIVSIFDALVQRNDWSICLFFSKYYFWFFGPWLLFIGCICTLFTCCFQKNLIYLTNLFEDFGPMSWIRPMPYNNSQITMGSVTSQKISLYYSQLNFLLLSLGDGSLGKLVPGIKIWSH